MALLPESRSISVTYRVTLPVYGRRGRPVIQDTRNHHNCTIPNGTGKTVRTLNATGLPCVLVWPSFGAASASYRFPDPEFCGHVRSGINSGFRLSRHGAV